MPSDIDQTTIEARSAPTLADPRPAAASPLDFFGSARDAPRVDANERVVLARAFIAPAHWEDAGEPKFIAEPWHGRRLLVPRPFYTALCSNSSLPNEKGRLAMHAAWWAWAYLLMVDDVGTKIEPAKLRDKLPPPTVILETSAGNFQHLWAYASRVNPADHGAALAWLADEGLTDKDAIGVARLCRIPNSTSYKALSQFAGRRPAFAARVVEFHADRLYPFAHLVPFREGTAPPRRHRIWPPLDVKWIDWDDVYLWLLNHDMVLRPPDATGWAKISCPWATDHDRNASNAMGTGWLVRGGLGRFHCPQCRARTREDVVAWIDAKAAAS